MKNSVGISLQLWKKTCRCVEIQNRTCLVHEFKHDCTTVLSTTPIGNHASTYAHTKKTSLKNEHQKCVLIDIIIHIFLRYFYLFIAKHMLSSSSDVYWLMNICHALFIFLHFSSYLTHAHHSIYIFMLTTSPCWWISLNVFINKLLLATTTGKQCSTILLLTWKKYVAYLTLSLLLNNVRLMHAYPNFITIYLRYFLT